MPKSTRTTTTSSLPLTRFFLNRSWTAPDVDLFDRQRTTDNAIELEARRAELFDLFEDNEEIRGLIGQNWFMDKVKSTLHRFDTGADSS